MVPREKTESVLSRATPIGYFKMQTGYKTQTEN